MKTERLYYKDSHMFEFDSRVLSCEPEGEGFSVTLEATAFFPEGGGQAADTGVLGGAEVSDVQEKQGIIRHHVNMPLPVGETVHGRLDREKRLRRMQDHSGEHVVSGIVHSMFGYDNVGFHMGAEFMTIDFSGELTDEDIETVEQKANETVRADVCIRATFPDPETLRTLSYRSKLDLTEDVRIVEIEGIDLCACCAPHCSSTGEIGLIKILTAERHRGGMRLTLVCGMDALDTVRKMQANATAVSNLLSAKRDEIDTAVQRLLDERDSYKAKLALLGEETAQLMARSTAPTDGNLVFFSGMLSESAMRKLANSTVDKCGGITAVFCGDEESGYRYIIASKNTDLRAAAKTINAGISGRGGGSSTMISGRASANEKTIRNYLENAEF